MTSIYKMPAVVSPAIRNLPKSEPIPCTLALIGCREQPEYTVLAHLRGKWHLGTAEKPHDFFAVYACDRCHDALDRRSSHAPEIDSFDVLMALYRSQAMMVAHGALKAGGA